MSMETKKSQQRFTEEFKVEAVKQVTEKGFAVAEVAGRLGVSAPAGSSGIRCLRRSELNRTARPMRSGA